MSNVYSRITLFHTKYQAAHVASILYLEPGVRNATQFQEKSFRTLKDEFAKYNNIKMMMTMKIKTT